MSTDYTPARESNKNANANEPRIDLEGMADRGEERLREHLREEYDREPTEKEVEWVRGYPERLAEGPHPKDPRPPTLTEMQSEFDWGATKSQKERWGEDFIEQQRGPSLERR